MSWTGVVVGSLATFLIILTLLLAFFLEATSLGARRAAPGPGMASLWSCWR